MLRWLRNHKAAIRVYEYHFIVYSRNKMPANNASEAINENDVFVNCIALCT